MFSEVDEFYGIGVPVFLEEGKEPLSLVDDVLWFDVITDVDVDEVPDKIREKSVVVEDAFETVIDSVMNGHIFLLPY
jgi:hypothetical protein